MQTEDLNNLLGQEEFGLDSKNGSITSAQMNVEYKVSNIF